MRNKAIKEEVNKVLYSHTCRELDPSEFSRVQEEYEQSLAAKKKLNGDLTNEPKNDSTRE